ncbi:midnolin isoform X3 [Choloepus didactylus]|uniref:midnolin isoform X3 n=1 Tax=Choloepus didactylus TaxID=27675 RepID=UPI00189E3AB7|nr:midnolin isoform X3 [Choloepus didactylus]
MEPQPGGARSCRRGAPGGACELGPAAEAAPMNLAIHSTTGTRYELSVPPDETVEGLRKRLSQRLKVPKERLALLHKDTRLSSGKLQEFGVGDGSKLTLVPTVEAGLMSQAFRPEQSVMQALESLTETQVSDFLSGRSPLTLALRVGDHMMFVQLQLAAQHGPLQHRHVLAAAAAAAAAARGDPSTATPVSSPCRPVSSTTRVPPVPTSSAPASPSVTAGSFRSHAASATCPEQVDCPPPASSGASTTSTPGGSPAPRTRKPGAVIESFVNHAPGVFSGTFSGRCHSPCVLSRASACECSVPGVRVCPRVHASVPGPSGNFHAVPAGSPCAPSSPAGTLHPNCQDSSGRPRRDIGTVLQILNDLLSATRQYQGMPPSLTQLRCHAQCAPTAPAPDLAPKTTSCEKLPAVPPASLLQGQSQIRVCKPQGDRLRQTENRATRCKVERLQLLLQQKRLRRKARRDARGPYHWPPSRKAGRSDSSGGGGGSPSEAPGLGLDFEESVWKPEVNPDIKSEFVVA